MRVLLYSLIIISFSTCFSQNYSVSSSQKINDVNGNFPIALDSEDWFGYAVEGIDYSDGDGVIFQLLKMMTEEV